MVRSYLMGIALCGVASCGLARGVELAFADAANASRAREAATRAYAMVGAPRTQSAADPSKTIMLRDGTVLISGEIINDSADSRLATATGPSSSSPHRRLLEVTLIHAAGSGDVDSMQMLLANGVSVNAAVPGDGRPTDAKTFTFDDPAWLARWPAPDRGVIVFRDRADVEARAEALRDLCARWLAATS